MQLRDLRNNQKSLNTHLLEAMKHINTRYIRSNFNTREFNGRELVQLFQLYSKRLSPCLTIFGHKITLFFLQLLITKRDIISIKEGQNSRLEISQYIYIYSIFRGYI